MKRYVVSLMVLVALVLTACQPTEQPDPTNMAQPTQQQNPTVEQPTEQTDSTVEPTTETIAPTEPPEVETSPYGYTFVFDGSNPSMGNDADISKCVVGYLYFLELNTNEIHFITDKALVTYNSNDTHAFYVPEDEPSKIFAVPVTDLTQHTLVYESENGKITDSLTTGAFQYFNTALQFVEDDRRYIWLDLTTGEAEVVLEQYYILKASVDSSSGVAIDENGQPYLESTNVIYFMGKLNEADDLSQYLYYRDTGKIEEVFWQ